MSGLPRLKPLLLDAGVAAAVAVASYLTISQLRVGPLTPIAFTAGVAIVAVLLRGARALPAIAIGMLASRFALHASPTTASTSAIALVLDASVSAWLLGRAGFRREFERPRDMFILIAVTLATGALRGALELGVSFAPASVPKDGFADLLLFACLGHAIGALLIVPPVLALRSDGLRRRESSHAIEMALVSAAVMLAGWWCFLTPFIGGRLMIVGLVLVPGTAWIALRGPRLLAFTMPTLLAIATNYGAAHTLGPFAHSEFPGAHRGLQAAVAAVALPSGLLAAAEGERRRVLRELRAREASLRASQALFEGFMRHSPVVAFLKDAQGRLLYVNRAFEEAMWPDGVPPWRGKLGAELFTDERMHELRDHDRQVLETGQPLVAEEHTVVAGIERLWLVVKFPVIGEQGEHMLAGMSLDITERRRAEEERRALEARVTEAQKLESLGLLAGGVAHDFNNILTSVLGYADLALHQLPPDSPAQPSLERVVSGARSAADLTRQMLAYAGHGSVAPQRLAVQELVRDMGQLLQVSIPKRCSLRYTFGDVLPLVEGDEAQLRQVVMNLILNASEACGDAGGTIDVVVRTHEATTEDLASRWSSPQAMPGPHVVLEVIDRGIGMDAATLARIFDPFFTTKFTGRGLGLAAVLGIVRGHRGAVQVESARGAGTTFRVLLPALAGSIERPDTTPSAPTLRGHGLVLVVDDEPSVRGLARAMLERLGFEVLLAANGREGLTLAREHHAQLRLILLDRTMPDLGGDEVLRQLAVEGLRVPVLLSSGYSETPTPASGDVTPAGFIGKPYRLDDLARAIRAALEGAAV